MMIERQQEKAYQAIAYLITHAGTCYKKKLFKLLFFLDFEHFEATGRSVTGYDYFAWKMGPVPTELQEAIESEDPKLLEHFEIERESMSSGYEDGIRLKSKLTFDKRYFSDRELALLDSISERFSMASGQELENLTHEPGTPWYKVWYEDRRPRQEIPYIYSLDKLSDDEKDAILDIVNERAEVLANYQ